MQTLLVVGCGDIARRALPVLAGRYRMLALVRELAKGEPFASANAEVIQADLDDAASLMPLAGRADLVLHLAPPSETGTEDTRTRSLASALERARILPQRLVYISTSGVYGDCGGDRVDETRGVNPQTERAARRVDAERILLSWGDRRGVSVSILRVPGLYAADRLPIERLKRGTPVLVAEDDVYTNHIHADDLAAICAIALRHALPGAIYNASDDSEMKMGDYFDLVADRNGLSRPPRITRTEAASVMPPALLSFMLESRRLSNRRMKNELGVTLRYPTVREGVPDLHFASLAAS